MRIVSVILLAVASVAVLGNAVLWLAPRLIDFIQLCTLNEPNRLVVRNSSGSEIPEVHVLLRDMDGRTVLDRTISRPRAGSSTVFLHELNDSEASIDFPSGGSPRRFESGYIDLWTGEGWVLEIQADGSVKQGYDYPGSKLE